MQNIQTFCLLKQKWPKQNEQENAKGTPEDLQEDDHQDAHPALPEVAETPSPVA